MKRLFAAAIAAALTISVSACGTATAPQLAAKAEPTLQLWGTLIPEPAPGKPALAATGILNQSLAQRLATRSTTHSVFGARPPLGTSFTSDGFLPFVGRSGRGLFGNDGIFLADLRGRTVYQVPGVSNDARLVRSSRGGRFITYEEDGQLRIYDLANHLIRTFPQGGDFDIDDLDVDAYGNVTYLDRDGRIHIFDSDNGQDYILPAAGRIDNIRNVSISGDGRTVLFSNGNALYATRLGSGSVYTLPFVGGRSSGFRRFGGLGGIDLDAFSISGNGNLVLYTDDGRARLLDLTTGFIDNLALLNGFRDIDDVSFLDGGNDRIVFTTDGRVQIYDRRSGLIDTLPIVNRDNVDFGGFTRGRFSFGRFF